MSARRSGRAKAPVKYTSDSEGSDFSNKKPRKPKATPKKRAKSEAEEDKGPSPAAAAPSSTKRAKRDADPTPAAQDKALKSQRKATWESYLKAHDVDGALLSEEPAREESITQTDSVKKYGIKKEDLVVLKYFEKKNPNPVFKNTIKLYVEEDVKELGFRKLSVLDGKDDGGDAVERGGEIWGKEHKNDSPTPEKKDKLAKPKTPKQTWTAYIEAHTLSTPDNLPIEPEESINQSDCKAKYSLLPGDLAVLPYFPKPNQKYGNTTKLFSESEVKGLAYRKAAVLGGVEEADEVVLLERGRELFEKE